MPDLPPLANDLLLRAARREPVERVPVWLMRQAGRYLPEFRAVRAEADFFRVCRTPDLACEVTLQPLRRFDLDAAILFSDILVVPQALGMEVQMVPGRGPHFPGPLGTPADLDRLHRPDVPDALGYVFDALRLIRRELKGRVPLIGFAGAPWTLMAYMIEGGGSKGFNRARAWLYAEPAASRRLLDLLSDVTAEYLIAQAGAGAQVLQLFDSHAGELSPDTFRAFALPALARIAGRVKAAHPEVPLITFARGAHHSLRDVAVTEADVVGLDYTLDPAAARRAVGPARAVQGNLDPAALYAPPAEIRARVATMLDGFRTPELGLRGLVANLGHGMHPDHDPEHARAFVDAVHELSEQALPRDA